MHPAETQIKIAALFHVEQGGIYYSNVKSVTPARSRVSASNAR